jgi:hypothetical protein
MRVKAENSPRERLSSPGGFQLRRRLLQCVAASAAIYTGRGESRQVTRRDGLVIPRGERLVVVPCVWLESRGSAPAAVWMGSGGSGAAPEGIYPLYAGWLRPLKFGGRSRSAPVFVSVSLLSDSAKVFQGKPSSNLTVGTGTGKGRNGDDRDGVAGGPAGAGFVGTWQERQAVLVGV